MFALLSVQITPLIILLYFFCLGFMKTHETLSVPCWAGNTPRGKTSQIYSDEVSRVPFEHLSHAKKSWKWLVYPKKITTHTSENKKRQHLFVRNMVFSWTFDWGFGLIHTQWAPCFTWFTFVSICLNLYSDLYKFVLL